MKRYVEVRQEHIDAGEQESPESCAIALAMKQVDNFVCVDGSEIKLGFDTFKCSPEISEWVSAFDSSRELVAPITILLDDEDEILTASIVQEQVRLTVPEVRVGGEVEVEVKIS